MIFEPINDNILVQIENSNKDMTTGSGIVIPKAVNAGVKQDRGVIISVGQGRYLPNGERIVPTVHAGEIVLFNKFAGAEIKDGDLTYLMIKENDILAKIRE
jgi:chaperonin GroES